jgi:hypothetical protein
MHQALSLKPAPSPSSDGLVQRGRLSAWAIRQQRRRSGGRGSESAHTVERVAYLRGFRPPTMWASRSFALASLTRYPFLVLAVADSRQTETP